MKERQQEQDVSTPLPKWTSKKSWRNFLTMQKQYCYICFKVGDAHGNPPRPTVFIVPGGAGPTRLKIGRDLFKKHVRSNHHPDWLNVRLDWTIPRRF